MKIRIPFLERKSKEKEKTFKNNALSEEGEKLSKPLSPGVKGLFRKAMEILAYTLENDLLGKRSVIMLSKRSPKKIGGKLDIGFVKGGQSSLTEILMNFSKEDEDFAQVIVAAGELLKSRDPKLNKFSEEIEKVKRKVMGVPHEEGLKGIIEKVSKEVPGAKVRGIDLDDLKGMTDDEISKYLDEQLGD